MGGLPTKRTVNGFAVSPADPRTMYVAMRDGLFKSTDAGESWKPAGKGLRNLAAVAVNPRRPSEVYVATADGVIFRSTDGGTTWERQK
ncbi:MAG: hypothetical protein HYV62_07385 [Candidatus Rokubacteria bacterium]|nr:hypothetical protein [Candidatus Rokubacteria bacterium]